MTGVLAAAVLLPLLATMVAWVAGRKNHGAVGTVSVGTCLVGFGLAVMLTVTAGVDRPVSAVLPNGRHVIGGWYADRLTATLLLLVLGVSAIVQAFATRYLQGDRRAGWFFAAAGVLTASSAGMVSAATLLTFALCWTVASLSLCALLGTYVDLAAARDGLRRTLIAFAVGDLALWLAVAIASATWGNVDLRGLTAARFHEASGATMTVVGCLLVVAALARCAQLPLNGWLPATLAAPTPVSALLHAGVVNAGGILLTRLAPVFGSSAVTTHLVFMAGAATTLHATAVMLTKADIKGALAHSTMGQMGFMLMTCGVGAFGAAIFHLLAHGMYKATLFLGSGSAVTRRIRHIGGAPAPALTARARQLMSGSAAVIAATAIVGAALLVGPHLGGVSGSWPLLLFAFATAAIALRGWLLRRPTLAGIAVAVVGAATLSLAYVAVAGAVISYLRPALHAAASPVSPWLLAGCAAASAAVFAIVVAASRGRRSWPKSVYVWALSAGFVPSRRPSQSRRPHPAAAADLLTPRLKELV